MEEKTCPIATLACPYTLNLQPLNASLFCFLLDIFFYFSIILTLKKHILLVSFIQLAYSGYSFCKSIV